MLLPGAVIDPGAHWNYEAGYTSALMAVWHYTVGNDSRALIRNNGLAPVLIRDGIIYQYAPLDACCFTQCEWNRRAVAAELESIDGTIGPGELDGLAYFTLFVVANMGIPQVFYDGPRLELGVDFRGVTNHRALVHRACDQHSDGFGREVWDQITEGTMAEVDLTWKALTDVAAVIAGFKTTALDPTGQCWLLSGNVKTPITWPQANRLQVLYNEHNVSGADYRGYLDQEAIDAYATVDDGTPIDVDELAAAIVAALPPGTVAPSADEVATAVRTKLHDEPLR